MVAACGMKEESLGRCGPRPGEIILPPWLGYPLSGCFPAEPDSVSPSKGKYTKIGCRIRQYTAARFPVMDGVARHHPSGETHSRATENYPQSRRAAQVIRIQKSAMGRSPDQNRRRDSDRTAGQRPGDLLGLRPGGAGLRPAALAARASSCRCGRSRFTSCTRCGASIARRATCESNKFPGATASIN
jgi:hypothetical protein